MKGRLKRLQQLFGPHCVGQLRWGGRVTGCIPETGDVLWFDVTGRPRRVAGYVACESEKYGLNMLPVTQEEYDLPFVETNMVLQKNCGFQSIFRGAVPSEDVEDNFALYHYFINSLESEKSYRAMVSSIVRID